MVNFQVTCVLFSGMNSARRFVQQSISCTTFYALFPTDLIQGNWLMYHIIWYILCWTLVTKSTKETYSTPNKNPNKLECYTSKIKMNINIRLKCLFAYIYQIMTHIAYSSLIFHIFTKIRAWGLRGHRPKRSSRYRWNILLNLLFSFKDDPTRLPRATKRAVAVQDKKFWIRKHKLDHIRRPMSSVYDHWLSSITFQRLVINWPVRPLILTSILFSKHHMTFVNKIGVFH